MSKASLLHSTSSQSLLADDVVLASASAAPPGKSSTSSLLDNPVGSVKGHAPKGTSPGSPTSRPKDASIFPASRSPTLDNAPHSQPLLQAAQPLLHAADNLLPPPGADGEHPPPQERLRQAGEGEGAGDDLQAPELVVQAPEQHLRVYNSERICTVCLKSFSAKNIQRHMKTHDKPTFVTCDQCGEKVGRQDHMKRHRQKCPRYFLIVSNASCNCNI